jgi:hypothetical protein
MRAGSLHTGYNSLALFLFALLILLSLSISATSALAAGGTFAPVGNLTQATLSHKTGLVSVRVIVIASFCYGPLSCLLHLPGPARTVPGRRPGMML